MRELIKQFCRVAEETLDLKPPIVEVGSFQVSGQEGFADLRPFFSGKKYIGCDMRPGNGVDRVENLPRLSFPDGSLPTIICLDTLEHVYEIRESISDFYRVLTDDGILIISSVFNFPIHGHPCDFWRFTPQCFARLLEKFSCSFVGVQGSDSNPHTVYGIGFKGRAVSEMRPWLNVFEHAFKAAVTDNLKSDVAAYIPKKLARRAVLTRGARYPYYLWKRARYARDQKRFYCLKMRLLGRGDAEKEESGIFGC